MRPGSLTSTFAIITAVATFALLVVGGTVNPTGSSLACPDWPLCYGSLMPEMVNGVQFEHTHRIVATVVGLLTCVLAVLLWRGRRHDATAAGLGLVAVAAVVIQGVLGGLTVLLRLPPAVSVSHLALSMLFFTLTIYLAVRLHPAAVPLPLPERPPHLAASRRVAALAWGAVYGQILLGALVRHTHAGHVCGADPLLCQGLSLWPALGAQRLHMLHRIVGAVVAFAAIAAAIYSLRTVRAYRRPVALIAALAVPWLALLQVLLGALTVMTRIAVVPVAAHLGVGALLLACFALISFELAGVSQRLGRPHSDADDISTRHAVIPALSDNVPEGPA